ncbi:MAG: glycosyltransferase family 4 protein [Pyrinomonadaceae bacterium]
MPTGSSALGRPLHLLILSNTEKSTHIQGADRDWVNLLNALGPERVRVSWAGVRETEWLRAHLSDKLITRFINLHFAPFYELFHQSMYRRRSARQWTALIYGVAKGLRRPFRQLRREMRNDPPDVVITNTSVVLVGALFSLLSRLPHVWCVKEFLDPEVAECRRYAWLIEKLSDVVIVPSESVARVFSRRVRVLHDGNDLRSVKNGAAYVSREQVLESLGLPPTQLVIVQTGALSHAKGQQVTARACAQLAIEGQGPCSILFLGFGTVKDKEELRRILAKAPEAWQASMRFLEFDPDDFSYLSMADIVVHPSVFPDPYPNAVREALILGKPIVGSRVGGIPDLIKDGLTGILVEPDDPASLACALKSLIASPQTRTQMSVEARQFAERSLDINIRKRAFLDILLSIVKS